MSVSNTSTLPVKKKKTMRYTKRWKRAKGKKIKRKIDCKTSDAKGDYLRVSER